MMPALCAQKQISILPFAPFHFRRCAPEFLLDNLEQAEHAEIVGFRDGR